MAPHSQRTRRWILLLPSLPPGRASARVRVWRRLQGVGAVALKNAVWVLPNEEEHAETFQWVAREIAELGGQTSLCESQFVDTETDAELERRFVEARRTEYAAVAKSARSLLKVGRGKGGSREKRAALELQHGKLVRRLEEIAAIDFFGADHSEAEALVAALGRSLAPKARQPQTNERLARSERPKGAVWVTRTGVHIDRIACSWLIKRFVDQAARFKFVQPTGYRPERGELRFDMFDAEFTHVGDRSSFEVLLERMGLEDPALGAIAEIVHDLDLKDAKFDRAETAGVSSAVAGICAAQSDDLARIAQATPLFEALYAFFSSRSRKP